MLYLGAGIFNAYLWNCFYFNNTIYDSLSDEPRCGSLIISLALDFSWVKAERYYQQYNPSSFGILGKIET